MRKNVKPHVIKNDIHSSMMSYRKEVVSTFESKSKGLLSNGTSKEDIYKIYDEYIAHLFSDNGVSSLEEFSDNFKRLFRRNVSITEQYMHFINSYMQSLTMAVNLNPSKIDIKDLKLFYKRTNELNQRFLEYNKKREIEWSHFELQQLFDAITDPLFVVDRKMNIIRINKFLKDRLNIKEYKDVLGKKANRIKYEGEPLCVKADLKEAFEKESVQVSDVHSKDDRNFYIQYIYPIKSETKIGNPVTSVLIYKKDMTMHKNLEEEVRHLNRLATVGRLSAIVAHEIRNPLSGIGLSASLLKKKLEKDWQYLDSIENILEGIDRIESVVLRLLDFSKPKKTNKKKVNIVDPLREALFFIKSRAEKQSIIIEEEYPESLPYVSVDPDQMTQVLINLLLNAIQSIKGAGKITINLSVDEDFSVVLRITDTGAGIKNEDIPHIFEPFFTTKTDGTGLGLTISKSILLQNEITISVVSKPEHGTSFTLKIKAHHEI